MQFELTTEFLENLKEAIAKKDKAFLNQQLHELYAADIAIIINQLDMAESHYLYDLLEEDQASGVLLEMDEDKREEFLSTFSTKEIAEQIDNMESDDAADVINTLPRRDTG